MLFAAIGMMVAALQTTGAPRMAGVDHPAAPCPSVAAPLPAELAGWPRLVPVTAGAGAAKAPALALGVSAQATLLPTPQVSYPLRPEKPGGAVGSGGLFAFAAPAAGRYRVALGSGAWIDVVQDGKPVASIAHGHGPDCSGVHKMVDFDLQPGRYLLQVAGNGGPTLSLMVTRLP